MKPLSLTLTAFGSYPGTETVDFSSLSGLGLYVVTGPTGSGKTTVFDAMAYALYGKVPGVRDAGDIRSHHAEASVLCSVTFRFEVDGVAYRIERSPEQFRAGKRPGAELVKQSAKAVLVRESDDVTLASKASAAAETCAGLVGLDAEQFERVVLLPQGRFQQFLLADTKERQPLLRQLFDTSRWLAVTERLKAGSALARAEVASIEVELGNHRHSLVRNLRQAAELLHHDTPLIADDESAAAASLDALDTLRAELDQAASDRRRAAGAAAEAARVASDLEATATRVVTDWTNRRDLRAAVASLESRAPDLERTRSQLAADAAAQPVAAAIAALASASQQAEDTAARLDTARQAVVEACADAGVEASASIESLVTVIAETRGDLATQRRALDAVIDATAACQRVSSELDDVTVERDGIAHRLGEIDADLTVRAARLADLEPVAAQLALQQAAVTESSERLDIAARVSALLVSRSEATAALVAATAEQQALTARFIADAAPRLAAQLLPDHPCPVCGSVEHPAPASTDIGDAVDAAELDRAAGAISKAAAAVEALDTELVLRRSSLGQDADTPIAQLEESLASARAACSAAEAAVGERDVLTTAIEAIRLDREALAGRASQLEIDLARLGAEQGAASAELATARAGLGELATRVDTEGAALVSALDSRGRALDHLETATTTWRTTTYELEGHLGAGVGAESLLAESIVASGLADRSAAEAALLAPEVRERLAAEVVAHDTERASIDARLPELEALDLPVDCPDIAALQTDAAEKRAAAAALADDVSRIDERLGEDDTRGARGDLFAARAIAATAADALARSDQLAALAGTCDGKGPRKVSLETFVLAGELDRVVIAASIHLERMTAGRYRLERSDAAAHGNSQAGLDLRVLDAHTGVARRPASLSGGEQFQASLALALGLADVVSQGGSASGRVFEALFVDEGFGSLDPESLGQAVDALHQIHATGRTVGVITHVEAMKEDLQLGIRVDRLPDGRGSTLHCHPEI